MTMRMNPCDSVRGSNQWKKLPNPCIRYRDTILKMVSENSALNEIEKAIGIHQRHIQRFLASEGMARPKKWRPTACNCNRDLILKMATNGASLNEIARAVRTNSRHIRAFLNKEGVQREYPKNYGGERSPSWKGGVHVSKGYIYLLSPDHPNANSAGYVREHRLVMEKMIGRHLLPNEVVHHKDGNPGNNSPDNLMLFSENREHLCHELKGKCPQWTPEGLARMKIAAAQGREKLRQQTLEASKRGVRLSHGKRNHPKGIPLPIPSLPLQMELQPEQDRPAS